MTSLQRIGRSECIEHAKGIFARLVRVLLGECAVAAHKLAHGRSLDVLGLTVSFTHIDYVLRPMADKIAKWSHRIASILESGRLSKGQASKLAGALSWSAQHSFHRLGRAMLRPLFAHARSKSTRLHTPVRLCLQWWLEVFSFSLEERQFWSCSRQNPVQLFADARGDPPRLAAVLLVDGATLYTDWAPPAALLEIFRSRRDNQIMGLELLAIALGLSTFADVIYGRRVVVWSDNTGGEAAARAGVASSWDHTCIVHCLWKKAVQLRADLFIDRVPSDDNIADLPSREDYELLRVIDAVWRTPLLDDEFHCPDAWEALSLRWLL